MQGLTVAIEEVSSCRKRLRIEIPPDQVQKEWKRIAKEFATTVRLPGFRQGKAPQEIVEKRFGKEITQELQNRLIPKAYQEVIQSRRIPVVRAVQAEEIEFSPGGSLSFSAIVDCVPQFPLPAWKGLSMPYVSVEVKEEEVDKALEKLLQKKATLIEVSDRPARRGDFALVSLEGRIGGVPVGQVLTLPRDYTVGRLWIWLQPDVFAPGFPEGIEGMKIGEKRVIPVRFPEDWRVVALRGKEVEYSVELLALKEPMLPAWTEELAQELAGVSLSELRDHIRGKLQKEKEAQAEALQKRYLLSHLLQMVECELPESLVEARTRERISEILLENQERGVPIEVLEEKKREIFSHALRNARDTVKMEFLFQRIAEAEGIEVEPAELDEEIRRLAQAYGVEARELAKKILNTGAAEELRKRLLFHKVLDRVWMEARIENS
ncbi:trigger factor [Candidatus Methylacidithermus pantelleriae]|uniref:Trigger factor n=1 Tax=Candidatus Methylacidithermus pantelleriae TaxID=2744239 RepID=A0A8J2BQE7_9BACT|nr:trigger factor [Candidatus Methylacidithermus pantelleriae]CAF0703595.1 Trigger factor [Candidatus Methylacidithermus pantelleriae]